MNPMLLVGLASVFFAIAIGLMVRRHIVFVAKVQSDSMSPTLKPGQWLLTARIHRTEAIERGDIVVAASPELGHTIIKRIIGIPGDRVVIDDDGHIFINEALFDEPYVATPAGPAATFAVPQNHVLPWGDNRLRSSDSRGWRQPFLPAAAIQGQVIPGVRVLR